LLQSETTEVSLLIVTPYVQVPYYSGGYYSRDVGLLILSPNIDPGVVPFGKIPIHYGLYLDVSAQTAIYIHNKVLYLHGAMYTLYGQHICMDSTSAIGPVDNLTVTGISCEITGGSNQNCVGISMNISAPTPSSYFCHMRGGIGQLIPAGETIETFFGNWNVGEVGDVVAGEDVIWYKTIHTEVGYGGWSVSGTTWHP